MQKLEKTFKLPSGVECSVTELVGKHQRILTEQSSTKHTDKLLLILKDIITRVGSKVNPDEEFIKNMLACDTKMALVQARQLSMDNDPNIEFTWSFVNNAGEQVDHKESVVIPEAGFPFRPVRVKNAAGELVPANYEQYDQIERTISITLPRTKLEVSFVMIDGKGEEIGATTKKKDRSTHTLLKMRRPVYKDKESNVSIGLDLDKLNLKDLEYLRGQIKEYEGQVDTEVQFEHPESEYRSEAEKYVTIDLLSIVAFFFPSEAI